MVVKRQRAGREEEKRIVIDEVGNSMVHRPLAHGSQSGDAASAWMEEKALGKTGGGGATGHSSRLVSRS